MRLIDADKLFPYGSILYWQDDGFKTADNIYGVIKNAPTIDAVPVVRCKDCKYLHEADFKYVRHCELNARQVDPDDFCSYGERRGGNEET